MKLKPDRLALFGAVLILLGGYLFVFRPGETSIAQRYGQLDDGRVLLARRLTDARRESELRHEAHALSAWLTNVGLRADRTTIVDRFLRELARAGMNDRVRITAVTADNAGPEAERTIHKSVAFDEIPMTVSLRGTYRNVLRLVHDLNRTSMAARIGFDSMGNADRTTAHDPDLRATVRVTLLRYAGTLKATGRASV